MNRQQRRLSAASPAPQVSTAALKKAEEQLKLLSGAFAQKLTEDLPPEAFACPRSAAVAHEAGHAVVGAHNGLSIARIKIKEPRPGVWGGETLQAKPLPSDPTLPTRTVIDYFVYKLAGHAAEWVFDQEHFCEGSSAEEIASVGVAIYDFMNDRPAEFAGLAAGDVLQRCYWRAMQILQHNEDVARDLMRKLDGCREVKGKQLATILQRVQKIKPASETTNMGMSPPTKPPPEQQQPQEQPKKERDKPLIVHVAEKLWGPAEARPVAYSDGKRVQYHIGRIVIDPNKDRWFDLENNYGGGLNDLMNLLQAREEADQSDELEFIDITRSPIPEREWLVTDRIPAYNVTILSGEGSGGKSIIALMLSAAVAMQCDWLGLTPVQGPVIYLSCEDDDPEICRRLDKIADYYGTTREELKAAGLHVITRVGQDATLAAPDHEGRMRTTKLFEKLHREAVAIKPKLIVIDTSADVFAGNEVDRVQVSQFINQLRGLAIDAGAAVLLISHPSLKGLESGSGLSGSTAWHNRPRARIFLTVEEKDGEREIEVEFKKNNYGPKGETIRLFWNDGVFLDVRETVRAEDAIPADQLFLQLLDRYTREGRNVSDKTGTSYAPAKFSMEPEAKQSRVGKKEFSVAMLQLFERGMIVVRTEGPPSHPRSRIVRTGKKGSYSIKSWMIVEGMVPDGVTCCQCHEADGELKLVQGLGQSKPEVLHWECAGAWFRPGNDGGIK